MVFLYKLVEGVAESSFGTHVAKLAGVPDTVVARAEVISADFARTFKEKLEIKKTTSAVAKIPLVAQTDFAYLVALGRGEVQMPEDPFRRKEVLKMMKRAARLYLQK